MQTLLHACTCPCLRTQDSSHWRQLAFSSHGRNVLCPVPGAACRCSGLHSRSTSASVVGWHGGRACQVAGRGRQRAGRAAKRPRRLRVRQCAHWPSPGRPAAQEASAEPAALAQVAAARPLLRLRCTTRAGGLLAALAAGAALSLVALYRFATADADLALLLRGRHKPGAFRGKVVWITGASQVRRCAVGACTCVR